MKKLMMIILLVASTIAVVAKPVTKKKDVKRIDLCRDKLSMTLGDVIVDYSTTHVAKSKGVFNYTGDLYYQIEDVCMKAKFLFVIGRNDIAYETTVFSEELTNCDTTRDTAKQRNIRKDIFWGLIGSAAVVGGVVWLLSTITIMVD